MIRCASDMRRYVWGHPGWPAWTWDPQRVFDVVDATRKKQYALLGALSLGAATERARAVAEALATTAVETSKIEGEILSPESVRSSVARRLGLTSGTVQDDRTEGVVEMTMDASGAFDRPLTAERLFAWHANLFPRELGVDHTLHVGGWRRVEADPMQVLSGPIGRERIHFEAPSAGSVPAEMATFLTWFNDTNGKMNGLVRVALAHLWFLTIHPFEDGNGRIGRAIADMALAQDEASSERFYSMSAQINLERNAYYDQIERAQRGDLDVTEYVMWLIACIARAIDASQEQVERAIRAMRFWDHWRDYAFNERQRKVLERYFGVFDGNLSLRKFVAISGGSRATAQRDIADLVGAGVLVPVGAGRATSYGVV